MTGIPSRTGGRLNRIIAMQFMIAELNISCLESKYVSRVEMTRRAKESMVKLIEGGKIFTGPIFGWDNVKDGTIVPNWDEQDLIDYMRHLFYNDKISGRAIAKRMGEDGVRGKRGGKFTSSMVLRTLRYEYHANRNKYPKPDWWGDSYYHDSVAWA